jgi:hypothetical protein
MIQERVTDLVGSVDMLIRYRGFYLLGAPQL